MAFARAVAPPALRWLWLALLLAALSACASWPAPAEPAAGQPDDPVASCRAWFSRLDLAVTQHRANDAEDHRVDGFPQLRSSRFLASFRGQAAQGGAAFDDWLALLRARGTEGHGVEIANLPDAGIAGLAANPESWKNSPSKGPRMAVAEQTQHCAQVLTESDRSAAGRRTMLLERAQVPDAYSTLARALGAYAITRLPFSAGVQRWQQDTLDAFAREAQAVSGGPSTTRFVPRASEGRDLGEAFARAPRNALGIPQLDEHLQQQLLDRHAPVFELPTGASFDRIGAMTLAPDGASRVDTSQPLVYRRLALVRHEGQTLVQLVYLAWFPERPRAGSFDLLAGQLDGLVWRVTLDTYGQPLLYDSIHACGCYHLFFPTRALRARPAPEPGIEWVFIPGKAPEPGAGERMVLRLVSGSHYLTALTTAREPAGEPYGYQTESALRSLPWPGGEPGLRRSLYGSDGIIAGTQRAERYLFWPMGVRDAGAQRQWGHHATAFVGRRHFDDPDLIDRRFERVEPAGLGARAEDH